MTIIVFLVVLGLVVFVHEFGHFLVAKLSGVKVEEFAFGFPPRIFSFRRGETRYSINLIPFGGYVRMLGEERTSSDPRSFSSQGPLRRLAIVLAGVVMNFLLAILFLWVGYLVGMAPLTLDAQTLSGKKTTRVAVVEVLPDSPAQKVGIRPGDFILGFPSTTDFQKFTKTHQGERVTLAILRGRKKISLSPQLSAKPEGPLGVTIINWTLVQLSPGKALIAAIKDTYGFAKMVLVFLGRFVSQLFQGKLAKEVAGPVGIYQITGQAVKLGPVYVIQWIAILSINLGLINAVPFPALDGGRALFVVVEALFRRKIVRAELENALHILGFALLLMLVAAVTYREVTNLVINRWSS